MGRKVLKSFFVMDALYCLLLLSITYSVGGENLLRGPRILSDGKEIVMNNGSALVLECEATQPIEWILPDENFITRVDYNIRNRTTIENMTPSPDYNYKSRLIVENTTYLDTDLYYCRHLDSLSLDDETTSAKIAVYVFDGEHLLVSNAMIVNVDAFQWEQTVIPCLPTHPDVEVSLQHYGDPAEESEGMTWQFVPHKGMVFEQSLPTLAGFYDCVGTHHGVNKSHDVPVLVDYNPDVPVPRPHINGTNANHVVEGETFALDCSVSMQHEHGGIHHLRWTFPSSNRTGHITEVHRSSDGYYGHTSHRIYHSILTVYNATKEDEGLYQCICENRKGIKETDSIAIKIYDQNASHLNISVMPTKLEINTGGHLRWVVEVDSYPEATITWYKEKTIISSSPMSRYTFLNNGKMMDVNSVEFRDAGEYRVEATNARGDRQDINLSLVVKGPPEVRVNQQSEGNLVHQNSSFLRRCEIVANPKPANSNVSIWYRDCLPPGSCNGSFQPLLPNPSNKNLLVNSEEMLLRSGEMRKTEIAVNFTGVARHGREYLCKACNTLGCSKETEMAIIALHITDLTEPLQMQLSSIPPAAGDWFSLNCSVNLYHYSAGLQWAWASNKGQVTSFSKNDDTRNLNLQVQTFNGTYSYTETLVWRSLPQTANGTYTCKATTQDGEVKSASTSILVYTPVKPTILKYSPKELEFEQGPNSTELFCDGYGVPEPEKVWYKDGELFTGNVITTRNGSTIRFPYLAQENSGSYKCVFSNKMGQESKEFVLHVKVPSASNKAIEAAVGVVIVVVIILVIVLAVKVYKEKKRKAFFRMEQLKRFEIGDPESINPDLGVDEQAELLPYDNRWEFPRERLKLGKQLGAGAFGRVLKAEAVGISQSESEAVTIVAVKMVKPGANATAFKALMSELKIMIHLGSHLNVVNLLGACTKNIAKGELLVIVEYCRYGNMQNYLIRHRDVYIDQVDHSRGVIDSTIGAERLENAAKAANAGYEVPISPVRTTDYRSLPASAQTDTSFVSLSPTAGGTVQSDMTEVDTSGQMTINSSGTQETRTPWRSNYRGDYQTQTADPICTRDLLCWAFQVARGMDYLTSRKVMHGDLAARNILLADERIVKIADFGLAREVYRSGNYKKKGDGPLPVKWMAPESIIDRNFSSQSDVWAFGIVLWELFSLGKTPYPGMEADERFLNKLLNGYRMDRPNFAPNDVYEVMQNCWETEPKNRPTFSQLEERLGNQLEASVRHHYIDLNAPYLQKNEELLSSKTDYLNMMSQPHYVNVDGNQDQHDYVNCPTLTPGPSSKQSDYLSMSPLQEEAEIPVDGAGYLSMTSPAFSSAKSNGTANGNKFNFDFAPRVKKTNEEADVIELSPMLCPASPEKQNTSKAKIHDDRKDSGFYSPDGRSVFNPNYVQQPQFLFGGDSSPVTSMDNEADNCIPQDKVPNKSTERHYVNQPGSMNV